MNIFVLDRNPDLAAIYHNDRHCVKMILESAQLLCTAHRVIDGQPREGHSASGRRAKRWSLADPVMEASLYHATHVNHPSAVWVRTSRDHYGWLLQLFYALNREYTYRYGKTHACLFLTRWLDHPPVGLGIYGGPAVPPPQAMPDECRVPLTGPYDWDATVLAYQRYYREVKKNMSRWTKRDTPDFMS